MMENPRNSQIFKAIVTEISKTTHGLFRRNVVSFDILRKKDNYYAKRCHIELSQVSELDFLP